MPGNDGRCELLLWRVLAASTVSRGASTATAGYCGCTSALHPMHGETATLYTLGAERLCLQIYPLWSVAEEGGVGGRASISAILRVHYHYYKQKMQTDCDRYIAEMLFMLYVMNTFTSGVFRNDGY